MKTCLFALIALASLTATSFADPCPTSLAGSCSSPKNTATCVDAIDSGLPVGTFEDACTKNSANDSSAYSNSQCSSDSLTGSCLFNSYQGQGAVVVRFYAPISAAMVPTICAQSHGISCE